MTNATTIQRDFWRTFNEILDEKGHPFNIVYEMSGNVKNWGAINRKNIWSSNMVAVSISSKTKEIRIDIYVENQNTYIGRVLNANRNVISSKISVPARWLNGVKQPNTLRLRYTIPLLNRTYRELIEIAWPTIMEFIAVAKEYGESEFFDIRVSDIHVKKEEYKMKKINDIVIGQTFEGNHAKLINQLFGTDYNQYMKAAYTVPYEPEAFIWMVYINGEIRDGWKNVYFHGHDTILEYNTDNKYDDRGLVHRFRYLFEKKNIYGGAYEFVYRGKYELQKESNNALRVLKRVDAIDNKSQIYSKSANKISVIHKTFGEGVIIGISNELVEVSFKNYGIKKFGYPSAFLLGYLDCLDAELRALDMNTKIGRILTHYCK